MRIKHPETLYELIKHIETSIRYAKDNGKNIEILLGESIYPLLENLKEDYEYLELAKQNE
jgi:hypothetical protein